MVFTELVVLEFLLGGGGGGGGFLIWHVIDPDGLVVCSLASLDNVRVWVLSGVTACFFVGVNYFLYSGE